jgi:hypothetical protein
MRVSPVAEFFDTLEEVELFAAISASVTHNHPEGIKGAQATAAAIFMAGHGSTKEQIKHYVEEHYGYDLSRRLDDIRPTYRFNETCQGSVPEAIICFMESTGLEDAIRNAVSLGGDADTQAAIAGSIAEAFYGLSDEVMDDLLKRAHEFGLGREIKAWLKEGPGVTRSAWKNTPMGAERERLDYEQAFSKIDYARIVRGWLPHEMEDKWFIYYEDEWLFFHRSWTGLCMFQAHLAESNSGYVIDEAWVTRDKENYKGDDVTQDAQLLGTLINSYLLNRPFQAQAELNILQTWSMFGRQMFANTTPKNWEEFNKELQADDGQDNLYHTPLFHSAIEEQGK